MFWFRYRKKKSEFYKIPELYLLENHFKVPIKKYKIDKIMNIVVLCNSLIFTIILISTMFIPYFFIRIIVMFVLLLPLIYLVYYGVSKYLQKKGEKDNV
jgi:hypothetical protein